MPGQILWRKKMCQNNVLLWCVSEELDPLCLDFGKSSDPVTPYILESKGSMVCKDLCQSVYKTIWNFYIEGNYHCFPTKTEIYMELPWTACCSLVTTTLKAHWDEGSWTHWQTWAEFKMILTTWERQAEMNRGKCVVLHVGKLNQLHK